MSVAKETSVNYVPFFLLASLFLALYIWNFTRVDPIGHGVDTTKYEYPAENYLAPDFSLSNMDGNELTLSDYRGKVVFLNFWATWCVTCAEEMPSMEKLYQRFKGRDFAMLTVTIDKEGKDHVQAYLDKYALTFPVMLDPDKKVANLYQTTGVPETFIINKSGVIIHKAVGPRDWSMDSVTQTFVEMIGP